jgi:hypothetical protein
VQRNDRRITLAVTPESARERPLARIAARG